MEREELASESSLSNETDVRTAEGPNLVGYYNKAKKYLKRLIPRC